MSKKIGIIGGTFNPIHLAHLYIAQVAKDTLSLDKIMFIPAINPYHKDRSDLISFDHRFKMVEKAIETNPDFIVSNVEQQLSQKNSYTFNLLKHLKETEPKNEFFFIMGLDSLFSIESWYKFQDLHQYATFVCFLRNEDNLTESVQEKIRYLNKHYHMKIMYFSTTSLDISSTKIRDSIRKKETIKYLIPDQVIEYIENNSLYKKE